MRAAVIAALILATPLFADEKLTIPTPNAAAKARLSIADAFGTEMAKAKTPAARKALAAKMLAVANDTKEVPANRWALYGHARDLAVLSGDLALSIQSLNDCSKSFAFDGSSSAADMVEHLSKLAVPGKALSEFASHQAEEAVTADDYRSASRLFAVALAMCKDRTAVDRIKVRARYAAELAKDYEAAKDDAEAMGRFQAFRKGNWAKGLPLLVKSKDDGLAAVAKKDAGNPVEAAGRIDLGDAWYELAGQTKGEERLGMLRRSMGWYRQGVGGLGGLARAKVEGRMAAVFQEVDAADAKNGLFTMLVGKWDFCYSNQCTRRYEIYPSGIIQATTDTQPDGKVLRIDTLAQLFRDKKCAFLNLNPSEQDRFDLSYRDDLAVEYTNKTGVRISGIAKRVN